MWRDLCPLVTQEEVADLRRDLRCRIATTRGTSALEHTYGLLGHVGRARFPEVEEFRWTLEGNMETVATETIKRPWGHLYPAEIEDYFERVAVMAERVRQEERAKGIEEGIERGVETGLQQGLERGRQQLLQIARALAPDQAARLEDIEDLQALADAVMRLLGR